MNLAHVYKLADGVAIRPERFGGLVYHYENRRLYFLHSHELTEFVSRLSGQTPLAQAMEAFRTSHGLSVEVSEALLKSLAALETMGIVVSKAA